MFPSLLLKDLLISIQLVYFLFKSLLSFRFNNGVIPSIIQPLTKPSIDLL